MSLRIMISSTRDDLAPYRRETSKVIAKLKADFEGKREIIETSMERGVQLGKPEYAIEISKRWVQEADWIVLIVGWNYGTISNETESQGLSVTEWEYRHAEKLKKKVFVFLTGERNTPDAYVGSEKEVNLATWAPEQDAAQAAALKKFRKTLSTPFAAFFGDIDSYSNKLETTLRRAIDSLPPEVEAGTALARLFLQVRPAITKLNDSIKLLTSCKDIHDALHDLLILVIKVVRERILSVWNEERTLSQINERKLNKLDKLSVELLTKIRISCEAHELAGALDLRESTGTLFGLGTLWDPTSESAPGLESELQDFSERLNNFELAVQDAFTCANEAMLKAQVAFDTYYVQLMTKIADAREQQFLSQEEKATLKNELAKIEDNRARLFSALNTHSDWQKVHDAAEQVVRSRGTDSYRRQLAKFINKYSSIMHRLTESALQSVTDDVLDGKLRIELTSLADALKVLNQSAFDDQFDLVDTAFDACFYLVDKRTLAIVKWSRERVSGFEALLEKLASQAG